MVGYSGGREPGRYLGEWVGIYVIPWPHYDRRHTTLCVMISSIWAQEWSVCVYTSWSSKRVPRPVSLAPRPGRRADARRLGNQDTAYWKSIRADCTVAPGGAATCQKTPTCTYTHALKYTPSPVKDYTRHIFIIVGGTWSQGQVNTFCLAVYEKGCLCGMYIKSISSLFASANWRKYQGVNFRIWASLSALDWRGCHVVLMSWKSKVFNLSLPNQTLAPGLKMGAGQCHGTNNFLLWKKTFRTIWSFAARWFKQIRHRDVWESPHRQISLNIYETVIISLVLLLRFQTPSAEAKKNEWTKATDLLSSVSLIASPPFKNINSPWAYKPLHGCLERGALPIVCLNNHFPWNENRSIIGHWYLLSSRGTSQSLLTWVQGLGLVMGAVMAENCPFSVDSELEVSKLNSGLLSLGTSRTPLMTSSLDILKKSLVIKENKQGHQTHSLAVLTNTIPRQSGG